MYPKNDYETLEVPNPYVLHIEDTLNQKHTIINTKPNGKGVIDFFSYLFKADVFFFNWIEDVSLKRYGKIQAVLFPLFIFSAKLLRKKIVWVMHNKFSHQKNNRNWTRFGFILMVKHSNLIITHSNSGIEFIEEHFPIHAHKVKSIIHPVEKMFEIEKKVEKKYDFLIWGTIFPYKGVIEFLDFASNSQKLKDTKILVSGVCIPAKLKTKLAKYLNKNVEHQDGFLDMEEIAKFAIQSKFILFTYKTGSVLSSGSLMDSIRMGASIIGPDTGAFSDLKSYSFIDTFSTYEDIAEIYEKRKTEQILNLNEVQAFCRQNSWESFGEKLFSISGGIF